MRRLYVIAITVVAAAVAVMLWSNPTISVTHKYQTASAFSWGTAVRSASWEPEKAAAQEARAIAAKRLAMRARPNAFDV